MQRIPYLLLDKRDATPCCPQNAAAAPLASSLVLPNVVVHTPPSASYPETNLSPHARPARSLRIRARRTIDVQHRTDNQLAYRSRSTTRIYPTITSTIVVVHPPRSRHKCRIPSPPRSGSTHRFDASDCVGHRPQSVKYHSSAFNAAAVAKSRLVAFQLHQP